MSKRYCCRAIPNVQYSPCPLASTRFLHPTCNPNQAVSRAGFPNLCPPLCFAFLIDGSTGRTYDAQWRRATFPSSIGIGSAIKPCPAVNERHESRGEPTGGMIVHREGANNIPYAILESIQLPRPGSTGRPPADNLSAKSRPRLLYFYARHIRSCWVARHAECLP